MTASIDNIGDQDRQLTLPDQLHQLLTPLRTLQPTSPEQAADALGVVEAVRQVATTKKAEVRAYLLDEVGDHGTVEGSAWIAAPGGGSYSNDYDDSALAELLAGPDGDLADGLLMALQAGLLSITWGWQRLENFCKAEGLPLRVQTLGRPGRADDPDPPEGAHVVRRYRPGGWDAKPLDRD